MFGWISFWFRVYASVPLLTLPIFWIGSMSLITYFILIAYQYTLKDQDLKTKYKAKWALVTGT